MQVGDTARKCMARSSQRQCDKAKAERTATAIGTAVVTCPVDLETDVVRQLQHHNARRHAARPRATLRQDASRDLPREIVGKEGKHMSEAGAYVANTRVVGGTYQSSFVTI